jgi:hypothetical protein
MNVKERNAARAKMLNRWSRLNIEYYKTKPRETKNICRRKKTAYKLQTLKDIEIYSRINKVRNVMQ